MFDVADFLITCRNLGRIGRLGNQLFQVAATIGIAHANGFRFGIPYWKYVRFFQGPLPEGSYRAIRNTYREPSFNFRAVQLRKSANLEGYFQSEKYFASCQQQVRECFAPKPEFLAYIDHKYPDLDSSCSVHVRRGDYVNGKSGLTPLSTDYYARAFAQLGPATRYVVLSDDIPWCRTHFTRPNFHFIEGERDVIDLFIMSRCRDNIIANSSFSWWGAWLNCRRDKRVFAPKRWFCRDVDDADTPDLIPDEWSRL